jgi:hypothetical protein
MYTRKQKQKNVVELFNQFLDKSINRSIHPSIHLAAEILNKLIRIMQVLMQQGMSQQGMSLLPSIFDSCNDIIEFNYIKTKYRYMSKNCKICLRMAHFLHICCDMTVNS